MNRFSQALRWALIGCLLSVHVGCASAAGKRRTITVAAASSLIGVMEEVAALWNERSDFEVRCTFNATSSLVRQIERGAPYDVLLSANRHWVDYLTAVDLVAKGDEAPLALNKLVVVASAKNQFAPPVSFSLMSGGTEYSMIEGRWALGDPDHVPVGTYAKGVLDDLNLWDAIKDHVVPAPSARAALRLVERGEVEFGIVYRTDALGSDLVVSVPGLPSPSSSIEVVGSPLRTAGPGSREFLQWLQGAEVGEVFRRYGFEVPEPAFSVEAE